jgi:hypothetical protein
MPLQHNLFLAQGKKILNMRYSYGAQSFHIKSCLVKAGWLNIPKYLAGDRIIKTNLCNLRLLEE